MTVRGLILNSNELDRYLESAKAKLPNTLYYIYEYLITNVDEGKIYFCESQNEMLSNFPRLSINDLRYCLQVLRRANYITIKHTKYEWNKYFFNHYLGHKCFTKCNFGYMLAEAFDEIRLNDRYNHDPRVLVVIQIGKTIYNYTRDEIKYYNSNKEQLLNDKCEKFMVLNELLNNVSNYKKEKIQNMFLYKKMNYE